MVNTCLESGICVRGTWQTFCSSGLCYFSFSVTALIPFTQSTFYLASSLRGSKLPPDTYTGCAWSLVTPPDFACSSDLGLAAQYENKLFTCCPRLDMARPQILLMFCFLVHSLSLRLPGTEGKASLKPSRL